VGAINLLAKRDKTGGDFCYSESLLSGGEISVSSGTERRGDWEGNGNSEIVEC